MCPFCGSLVDDDTVTEVEDAPLMPWRAGVDAAPPICAMRCEEGRGVRRVASRRLPVVVRYSSDGVQTDVKVTSTLRCVLYN